ncbi:MAG: hypothetical protein LBJ74_04930 [Heliobacteriaceae bacterium]|jgi:hypothetical protein|nr:hypothetical protein [Heliobacteriaceae bacterium]
MSVNSIQNSITNRNDAGYVRPSPPKGRLIKSDILGAPVLFAEDIGYKARALKHAIKGTANDHELGKINDLGMFAGGLGIASYLFTRRPVLKSRTMEFIGLGSFLASMLVWPQVAVRLPARLIHGVDVQQKYEDSFGRKKLFFQDPQYIPWDLYSDEDINKIGNRMRVPKDIPNRREAIQAKMKKVAVQNNTLWMLTAGFATPIMSALICNRLEKPVENYLKNRQNKKLEANFEDFEQLAAERKKPARLNAVKELIKKNHDNPINKRIFDEMCQILTLDGMDIRYMKQDLNKALSFTEGKYHVTPEIFDNFADSWHKRFAEFQLCDEDGIVRPIEADKIIKKSELAKIAEDEKFIGNIFTEAEMFEKHDKFRNNVFENIKKLTDVSDYTREMLESLVDGGKNSSEFKILTQNNALMFDSDNKAKIEKIADMIDDFESKRAGIIEFKTGKTGRGDTVIAKLWTDMQSDVLRIFEFSAEDIEKAGVHETAMLEKLTQKFEMFACNKEKYNNAVSKLAQMFVKVRKTLNDDGKYEEKVKNLFNEQAKTFKEGGLVKMAERLTGPSEDPEKLVKGSMRHHYEVNFKERIEDLENTIRRMWNALDFFKRAPGLNESPENIAYAKELFLNAANSTYECKFNCSSEAYKTLIRIMYAAPYHTDTIAILEKNNLLKGAQALREDIVKLVGNHTNELKPHHIYDQALEYAVDSKVSSQRRGRLIGNKLTKLFFKSSQAQNNTNKWLKVVGIPGAILLGATILAQFSFGKDKTKKGGLND